MSQSQGDAGYDSNQKLKGQPLAQISKTKNDAVLLLDIQILNKHYII